MGSADPLILRSGNVYACFPCIQDWRVGMDELAHGLEVALTRLLKGECNSCEDASTPLPQEYVSDPAQLSIVATIFLGPNATTRDVEYAIRETLDEIKVQKLNKVILSFHEKTLESSEAMAALWKTVETYQDSDMISTTSVRNVSVAQLESLLPLIKRQPESICVDMSYMEGNGNLKEYAESKGMSLLVHGPSDQADLFLPDSIPIILTKYQAPKTNFSLRWIVRFAVVVSSRQVVEKQGYIYSLEETTTTQ